MSVKIRLSRGGTKKRPYYYIVVAESTSPRDGRYIEQIGTHNPLLPKDNADRVKLDIERAKHWLSVGAQPTDRVLRFLDAAGLIKREARNNPQKSKPKKKRQEREAAAAAAAVKAARPSRRRDRSGGRDRSQRILLGRIAGAHGIRGDVLIKTFTEAPENIGAYGPLSDESGTRSSSSRARARPRRAWWRASRASLTATAPKR